MVALESTPVKNDLVAEAVRIALRGEFDMSNKAQLKALLHPGELAEMVVIDMSETAYLDATALTCLIRLKKAVIANGGGEVHLIGVTPNIRKLLTLTKLDSMFQISDDCLRGDAKPRRSRKSRSAAQFAAG